MSGMSEKDILLNIKESVEDETPEVWNKIQNSEKCRYDFEEKPLKSKYRNVYKAGAAAAACLLITFAGLKINNTNPFGQREETLAYSPGQNSGTAVIAPGVPQDAAGRDVATGGAEIYKPYTKDADAAEASKALKFDIVTPSWLPEGFTAASAKLFSMGQDGSKPYMYNIEYKNPAKKLLTLSITKYMTEEEKLKAQPAPMPMPEPAEGGSPEIGSGKTTGSGGEIQAVPPIAPDTPPQSVPGYNPSEPAPPAPGFDKPSDTPIKIDTPQDGGANGSFSGSSGGNISSVSGSSGGNSGSAGTGTSSSGPAVSVQFVKVKVKGIDVSMTVSSAGENAAVSAYWVYNGGNYNIYTDSIPKDDMIKIIESLVK